MANGNGWGQGYNNGGQPSNQRMAQRKPMPEPPMVGPAQEPEPKKGLFGKGKKKSKPNKSQGGPSHVGPAQVKPTYTGGKGWGIKSVALLLVITIMLSLTYVNLTVGLFEEPGIEANMEDTITGKTISELSMMEFTVANKSRRDVSANTVWTLNNTLISQGSNSTMLDIDLLQWGLNYLVATNGEDSVTYSVDLSKSISDTDQVHTMLSMITPYGEGWYSTGESFTATSAEDMSDIVKANYNNVDYGNGTMLTEQKFRNGIITLETTESQVYSLSMGYPMYLPESFANDYAVQVSGNWDNVHSARLLFDLQGTNRENWVAVKYRNGKITTVTSSDVSYSNGKLAVNINQDGVYMLRSTYYDNSNLITQYDIAILELYDTDVILTDDLAVEPSLQPADSASQLSTEFYTELLNRISDDAEEKSQVELQLNLLTWYRNTAMLNKDGTRFIRDYTNSSVQAAIESLLDRDRTKTFQKLALIIMDVSQLSNTQLSKVAHLISMIDNFEFYQTKFILVGDNAKDIRTMADIENDAVIYVLSNANDAKSLIPALTSSLLPGSTTTVNLSNTSGTIQASGTGENTVESEIGTANGTGSTGATTPAGTAGTTTPTGTDGAGASEANTATATILVDTGFDLATNGAIVGVGLSDYTNASNSFGASLLSKLAFTSAFDQKLVASVQWMREGAEIPEGMVAVQPTLAPVVTPDLTQAINTGSINELEEVDIKPLIDLLDLSQFNYSGSLFETINKYKQDGGYTFFIEDLVEKMRIYGPIPAVIDCNFGGSTVLITKVSQDTTDLTKFYLHIYQPFTPGIEGIITIDFFMGKAPSNALGYGYDMTYSLNGIKFNRLSIVSQLNIFQDGTQVFAEELTKN